MALRQRVAFLDDGLESVGTPHDPSPRAMHGPGLHEMLSIIVAGSLKCDQGIKGHRSGEIHRRNGVSESSSTWGLYEDPYPTLQGVTMSLQHTRLTARSAAVGGEGVYSLVRRNIQHPTGFECSCTHSHAG